MDESVVRGRVMHIRRLPVENGFSYPVFFLRVRLDTDRAESSFLFGRNVWRPVALWDKDYGPRDGSDLYHWAMKQFDQAGIPVDGKLVLQAFPRVWGYLFHPVSFFMAYDREGQLRAVIADVNNTFGQHTHYVLDVGRMHAEAVECAKKMHVSPFNRLEGGYRFRFREYNNRRSVSIDYWIDDQCVLRTGLSGRDQPLDLRHVAMALLHQPFLTVGIMARILWQAFRLWRKGLKFHGLESIQKNSEKGAVL